MGIEQICTSCEEINLVDKSYNCNKCGVWNKFEESVPKKKKEGKKWLS